MVRHAPHPPAGRYAPAVILYATLGLCALAAATVVLRYDLYDREPLWLLAVTVLLGAGTMPLLGALEYGILGAPAGSDSPWRSAAVASLVEEGARVVLVALIWALSRRRFNDPLDGLVYGCMAGLGMALWESVDYLRDHPGAGLPAAEVVRVTGHMVLGGIAAFPLGPLRVRRKGAAWWFVPCMAAALALHFIVDGIALSAEEPGYPGPLPSAAAAAAMLGGLVFFHFLVVRATAWSRAIFAPE